MCLSIKNKFSSIKDKFAQRTIGEIVVTAFIGGAFGFALPVILPFFLIGWISAGIGLLLNSLFNADQMYGFMIGSIVIMIALFGLPLFVIWNVCFFPFIVLALIPCCVIGIIAGPVSLPDFVV